MMDPVLAAFAVQVQSLERRPPQIPVISNVTGDWLTAAEAVSPDYWCRHLRQTVRFADGIARAAGHARSVFLEVGPGATLKTALAGHDAVAVLSSMRAPREASSDRASLSSALGGLWLAGVDIDWPQVHDGERRRRVPLPTYPFERRSYWIAAAAATSATPAADTAVTPLIEPASRSAKAFGAADQAEGANDDDTLVRTIQAQLGLMEQQLELLQVTE
jgi:phthiocerol/phenolphthiocerol synthesis type-I polyketide synthase E